MKLENIKGNILFFIVILFCISCQDENIRYLCNTVNQISACALRSAQGGLNNYQTQNPNYMQTQQNYTTTQTTQGMDIYTCIDTTQNTFLQQVQNDPNIQMSLSQEQHNRINRAMNSFSTCRNNSTNTGTGLNTGVNPNMYTNPNMNPAYNQTNTTTSDPTIRLKQCIRTLASSLKTTLSC
ncbi:MAG: hypothetical protein OXK80_03820 [Bdellovibrionales bacterium]|nr:hypothetical protein [Bdellovibrionales bacterium]